MFWTDWGSAGKIERAGMDGTHRQVGLSTGAASPGARVPSLGAYIIQVIASTLSALMA